MWFRVDPRASTPVYLQVVEGVRESVARGLLSPGDRLPSVRELASQMMLNHNTVAKAYQELEHERVIEVIRGRGTFIADPRPPWDRSERVEKLSQTMRQLLIEAHYLQIGDDELMSLWRQAIREWEQKKGRGEADAGH